MAKLLGDNPDVVPQDTAERIAKENGYPIANIVRLVSDGRSSEQWQTDRYGNVVFPTYRPR